MSVVVTAVMHPADGRTDDVLAGIAATIGGIHAEDGCLLYAPHRAEDGSIVLVEKWESRAHLDAHLSGQAVAALRAALAGLMAAPTDITVVEAVPLGEPGKGAV